MLLQPRDAMDVALAVQDAAAARRTLEIVGRGTRRDFGGPVAADGTLDLSALSGITSYEPDELVLTVQAATPIAQIEQLLHSNQQHLAFEPPDLSALWGRSDGAGSIGGALATGLGGSRRASAGAPRDHFLGFKAVNGLGQAYSAGARVVKNVTGYDLPKLLAGSFGTLGVLTEVTLKVLPAPSDTRTLAFFGLEEHAALALLRAALGSPVPVSGAAFLPATVVKRLSGPVTEGGAAVALLRLEGVPAGVAAGAERLVAQPGQANDVQQFDASCSRQLWAMVGSARAFAGSHCPVWRLSIPPATAAAVGEALRAGEAHDLYYDWAGGAVWVEAPQREDGGAALVRGIATGAGGHALLVRAAREVRERVDACQPLEPALAALSARVQRRFDPLGLFNPGRMLRSG